jgi:2-amino-4-hydroxy-6-hydroxymethyldihydropteridine diphosphokinase
MYRSLAPRILVGLGSNVKGPWGTPAETIEEALRCFSRHGLAVTARSTVISSAPYGDIDQPVFANAVAAITTVLPPEALLRRLHSIEAEAGRKRGQRWGPRTLDLDLLTYGELTAPGPGRENWRRGRRHPLALPHPEIAWRAFVLEPIAEIAPFWHHPVTGLTAAQMSRRRYQAASSGGQVL